MCAWLKADTGVAVCGVNPLPSSRYMSVEQTLKNINPANATAAYVIGLVDGQCKPKKMGTSGMSVIETFIIDKDGTAIELKYCYRHPRMDVLNKLKDGSSLKICKPAIKNTGFRWSGGLLPKCLEIGPNTQVTAPPVAAVKDIPTRRAGMKMFADIGKRIQHTGTDAAVVDLTGMVLAVSIPRETNGTIWTDLDMVDKSGMVRVSFGREADDGESNIAKLVEKAQRGDVFTVHGVRAQRGDGGVKISSMKNKRPHIYKNANTVKTDELVGMRTELLAQAGHATLTALYTGSTRAKGEAGKFCLRALNAVVSTLPQEQEDSFLTEVAGVVVTEVQSEDTIVDHYCAKDCRKRRANCTCQSGTDTDAKWDLRAYAPKVTLADYSGALEVSVDGSNAMTLLGGFSSLEEMRSILAVEPMTPILTMPYTVRIYMKNKPSHKDDSMRIWAPSVVDVAPETYEDECSRNNMGGQAVSNWDKQGAVMPVLSSMLQPTDDGTVIANNELCAYVSLHGKATRDMELKTIEGACELTGEMEVMHDFNQGKPFTVKIVCPIGRALGMNVKKGQEAIIFVNNIDMDKAEATVAAITVLSAQTLDGLEKQKHGFYLRAKHCQQLVEEAQADAIETKTEETETSGKPIVDREIIAKLRGSPRTQVISEFCTPAKGRSDEDDSPPTKRKRLCKAIEE